MVKDLANQRQRQQLNDASENVVASLLQADPRAIKVKAEKVEEDESAVIALLQADLRAMKVKMDEMEDGPNGVISLLQADLRTMKLKKEEIEEKVTCKLCMDAEVSTVFTPCGHACCCQACALKPGLVMCPICRGDIVSKDRIFFN